MILFTSNLICLNQYGYGSLLKSIDLLFIGGWAGMLLNHLFSLYDVDQEDDNGDHQQEMNQAT
jgi:hypothetical protein